MSMWMVNKILMLSALYEDMIYICIIIRTVTPTTYSRVFDSEHQIDY